MHFLVDAQLPPALAKWFVGQGHAGTHVTDLGLERANDRLIWARAIELGAVIVTKDEDFAVRRALESNGPAIVWVRFSVNGSVGVGRLSQRVGRPPP
jgi:predicted nuclease of predicted toxin-antitoxin system